MTIHTFSFCVIFAILGASLYGQVDEIKKFEDIRYEYHNADSTKPTPLFICVPGFTQHNRSPEFLILKDHFASKSFSYLIMNPPQHGEDYGWFDKIFSWGENEVSDLKVLSEHLRLAEQHNEIHLLGFSIGARIVLKFAARSGTNLPLTSVVAVAAPYSLTDINMRPSGDIRKISEGLISSLYATDRADLVRIAYMSIVGLTKAFLQPGISTADAIESNHHPTLLLHGADDWLTKSYHSAKLFEHAQDSQKFALAILNTRTHAEDMLSRDGSQTRNTLLRVLDEWIQYIKSTEGATNSKQSFKDQFNAQLYDNPEIRKSKIFDSKITLMSAPTTHDASSNLWISQAEYNHSLLAFNSSFRPGKSTASNNFLTIGSTRFPQTLTSRFRAGFAFQLDERHELQDREVYLSYYWQYGSVLTMRRVSYIAGIANEFNRKILSLDLVFYLIDFQLNFGHLVESENDWQITFHCPLISDASGSYYFGIGYSKYLTSVNAIPFKDSFSAYMMIGPKKEILQTRLRFMLQFDKRSIAHADNTDIWRAGLSVQFRER